MTRAARNPAETASDIHGTDMENVTTSKSTKSSESKSARSVSSSDATGNVPAQRSSGKKRMKRKAGGEASDAVESSIVVIKSELSDDSDLGDWPAPPTKRRWEILGNSVSSSASVAVRTASGIQRSQTSPPSKPAALSGPEMQVRAPDPACAVSKATKSKNDGLRPDGERTVTRALRKRKARSQTWEDDDDDSSFVESTYRFARHAGENESDDEIVISGVIPAAPQPTMTGTLTRGQQTTLAQHGARLVKAVDSIPMVDQEESGSDTEREYKVYRITNRQEFAEWANASRAAKRFLSDDGKNRCMFETMRLILEEGLGWIMPYSDEEVNSYCKSSVIPDRGVSWTQFMDFFRQVNSRWIKKYKVCVDLRQLNENLFKGKGLGLNGMWTLLLDDKLEDGWYFCGGIDCSFIGHAFPVEGDGDLNYAWVDGNRVELGTQEDWVWLMTFVHRVVQVEGEAAAIFIQVPTSEKKPSSSAASVAGSRTSLRKTDFVTWIDAAMGAFTKATAISSKDAALRNELSRRLQATASNVIDARVAFTPLEEDRMGPEQYSSVGAAFLVGVVTRFSISNETNADNVRVPTAVFETRWINTAFQTKKHVHQVDESDIARGFTDIPTLAEECEEIDDAEYREWSSFRSHRELNIDLCPAEVEAIEGLTFSPTAALDQVPGLFTHPDGSTATKLHPDSIRHFGGRASSSCFAFLPLLFWKQVVGFSNAHASANEGSPGKPIQLDEIMKLFGILWYMALIDKGEMRNYWLDDDEASIFPESGSTNLTKIMSWRRFSYIRNHLSFRAQVALEEVKHAPAAKPSPERSPATATASVTLPPSPTRSVQWITRDWRRGGVTSSSSTVTFNMKFDLRIGATRGVSGGRNVAMQVPLMLSVTDHRHTASTLSVTVWSRMLTWLTTASVTNSGVGVITRRSGNYGSNSECQDPRIKTRGVLDAVDVDRGIGLEFPAIIMLLRGEGFRQSDRVGLQRSNAAPPVPSYRLASARRPCRHIRQHDDKADSEHDARVAIPGSTTARPSSRATWVEAQRPAQRQVRMSAAVWRSARAARVRVERSALIGGVAQLGARIG
ncbi:hypothetical protein ON010_g11810 [Phytophthora cinnamomi]|nr:hypothetical protein ON010_g11810 [Phytophthora cinnamomi]